MGGQLMGDNIPALNIDAIKARAEAATEGPWMVDSGSPDVVLKPDKPGSSWDGMAIARVTTGDFGLIETDNTEFIAHAREDIPALLAALAEQSQLREAAERRLKDSERGNRRYAKWYEEWWGKDRENVRALREKLDAAEQQVATARADALEELVTIAEAQGVEAISVTWIQARAEVVRAAATTEGTGQ